MCPQPCTVSSRRVRQQVRGDHGALVAGRGVEQVADDEHRVRGDVRERPHVAVGVARRPRGADRRRPRPDPPEVAERGVCGGAVRRPGARTSAGCRSPSRRRPGSPRGGSGSAGSRASVMYAFVGCQNGCRRTPSVAAPACASRSASAAAKSSQEEESYIAPSVIPIRIE